MKLSYTYSSVYLFMYIYTHIFMFIYMCIRASAQEEPGARSLCGASLDPASGAHLADLARQVWAKCLPMNFHHYFRACCFGCLKGASKLVQVLLSGIEAVMVLTENSEIASPEMAAN